MSNIEIKRYVVGPVDTNCYVVINKDTNEAIIIDPGATKSVLISDKVKELGVKPVAILATHGHFDHMNSAEALGEEYGVSVYIHENEQETMADLEMNASWMVNRPAVYKADVFLKDEQEIDLAGFHIRVLSTPGHTPGGCCYYFPYEGLVFTGDTLFAGSVGRTDFKKGSSSSLVRSIREKLMTLPDNTAVYPGHNDFTTIEEERIYNPFI